MAKFKTIQRFIVIFAEIFEMPDNRDTKWFEDWFDSPYYHTLYNKRDSGEAESFIDNLVNYLHPAPGSRFLDLACGKGRHSIYLNKKGYATIGIDLSPESIAFASRSENPSLQFYIQDMRKPFRINYFDYVLNMFTSFGYFETDRDDNAVLNAVYKSLKPDGTFVLDFMNVKKIIPAMWPEEQKTIDDIHFRVRKSVEKGFIRKTIEVTDKGAVHHFEERVKVLTLEDFQNYFSVNKLKIVDLRGDYGMGEFNEKSSDRLIIIAKKDL